MRRPPLISYLTYNRLGNTAISLTSLLRTFDEFELYLIDNGSRDDTWQFLNDTRDPRIKERKRFDDNIGCAHAVNYALSFRKEDQDWINYEYDVRIHDLNFITHFNELASLFPEFGGFSATCFPNQTSDIDKKTVQGNPEIIIKDGKRIYLDTIMGFCSYYTADTMNLLGYVDETVTGLDIELNSRIKYCLGKKTGYAVNIHVSNVLAGGYCPTCIAYHNPCIGDMTDTISRCMKFYSRIVTKVHDLDRAKIGPMIRKKTLGEIPVKCNSIFSGIPMTVEELEASKRTMALYTQFTNEFLATVK